MRSAGMPACSARHSSPAETMSAPSPAGRHQLQDGEVAVGLGGVADQRIGALQGRQQAVDALADRAGRIRMQRRAQLRWRARPGRRRRAAGDRCRHPRRGLVRGRAGRSSAWAWIRLRRRTRWRRACKKSGPRRGAGRVRGGRPRNPPSSVSWVKRGLWKPIGCRKVAAGAVGDVRLQILVHRTVRCWLSRLYTASFTRKLPPCSNGMM